MYAAVVFLLSDAVVELLCRQQLGLRIVVASDCAGDPGEVLEALLPLGNLVVRAAQLGHLDLELVARRVPDGEGEGGRVPRGGAQVEVGVESRVGATEVRIAAVGACSTRSRHHCLCRCRECQSIRVALTLVSNTSAGGSGHLEGVKVEPHTTDVILALGNRVGEGVWGGGGHVVARVARVDDVG